MGQKSWLNNNSVGVIKIAFVLSNFLLKIFSASDVLCPIRNDCLVNVRLLKAVVVELAVFFRSEVACFPLVFDGVV